MLEPDKSILACPACERALINVGSRVARPQFAYRWYRRLFPWLTLGYFIWVIFYIFDQSGHGMLGVSFGTFALCLVPFVLDYFITRLVPIWRVMECPYCHHTESRRLGRSTLPED